MKLDLEPQIFLNGNALVLDFETSNTEFGTPLNFQNKLLLACWEFEGKKKSKWGGENEQQELLDDIRKADFIVAQNAKFELGWLRRCGADLRSLLVYDTMLAEWVLLGNQKEKGLSLQASCERRGVPGKLDLVAKFIKLGINPENIPRDWMQEYCSADVEATRNLFNAQLRLLTERSQLHLVYQRGLVCACLADMEFAGLYLDKDRVNEEYEKILAEYIATKEKLEKYGEINWRSPKQVAELLYDGLGFKVPRDRRGNPQLTAAGARPTDQATISSLIPSSAEQREFIQLFKSVANLNARLSKSLEFFKGVCDRYDCTFYGLFNQGTTATHRLSSSGRPVLLPEQTAEGETKERARGVQFQNLPREYKRLFRARKPGYVLVDCDASQLEFRVSAELSKDELANREIEDGVDVHSNTVEAFAEFGEVISRQDAKPQTFKPLYGGRGNTAAEKAYCKFFQNKYKDIYKTQEGWTNDVLKTGELRTPYGLRFYWPGTTISRYGYIDNTTAIFNYPIQGMATGELIPLIVVSVHAGLKDLRAEIICTVHDSVLIECHEEDVAAVKELLIDCFTNKIYQVFEELYGYKFKTQLGCEVKVSEWWGEGKGEKYEALRSS